MIRYLHIIEQSFGMLALYWTGWFRVVGSVRELKQAWRPLLAIKWNCKSTTKTPPPPQEKNITKFYKNNFCYEVNHDQNWLIMVNKYKENMSQIKPSFTLGRSEVKRYSKAAQLLQKGVAHLFWILSQHIWGHQINFWARIKTMCYYFMLCAINYYINILWHTIHRYETLVKSWKQLFFPQGMIINIAGTTRVQRVTAKGENGVCKSRSHPQS